MSDLIVRPSTKLVKAVYLLCVVIAIAVAIGDMQTEAPLWPLYAFPIFGFLWAVLRHLSLRFSTLTLTGGKLRYEEGILSRSTRTLDLAKIQDVRVDQSILNRILGIGNLTLETAGETGRLSMLNIDKPHKVADRIHDIANKYPDTTLRSTHAS